MIPLKSQCTDFTELYPLLCNMCSYLGSTEGFDRGYYAGPFGWISGAGAEFVVAIRSALMPQTTAAAAAEEQQEGQQVRQ